MSSPHYASGGWSYSFVVRDAYIAENLEGAVSDKQIAYGKI